MAMIFTFPGKIFYGKDFCWVVDFNGFLWGGFPGQDFYGEDFLRLREDFLREVDFYGFLRGEFYGVDFFTSTKRILL